MKFKESTLKLYAEPISETEEQKCKNAINMVRNALKDSDFTDDNQEARKMYDGTLSYSLEMKNKKTNRKIKIFVQGSYANGTNIKANSDVDIAIIQETVFKTKYPNGINDSNYGFENSNYRFSDFKNDIQTALKRVFSDDIVRGNKSIKINGNSYRTQTDTIPALRYRDYSGGSFLGENNYVGAIYILADDGTEIINYPEQHIINGKTKNKDTNNYYKKMVRIMKKMSCLMEENGVISSKKVSSFGLESLLWNVPNKIFTEYSTYRYAFDEILNYLLKDDFNFYSYKEANGIKTLFSSDTQASEYKLFLKDLKSFYQYDIKEA